MKKISLLLLSLSLLAMFTGCENVTIDRDRQTPINFQSLED
ncbi:MAG: hypothetical protein ACRC7S_12990 [Cetobacterium sp.]